MIILLFVWSITTICIKGIRHTFLIDNEGWCIRQTSKQDCIPATHYIYNTGVLNRYIGGKDSLINVDRKNKDDRDLWYFVLPMTANPVLNAQGSYALTFSMTGFIGDFKQINANVRNRAIIIKTNTGKYWLSLYENYDGTPKTYWIPMLSVSMRKKELDGSFSNVSDRELKEIVKNIQEIAILGDWTRGVEMIGLDNVAIQVL